MVVVDEVGREGPTFLMAEVVDEVGMEGHSPWWGGVDEVGKEGLSTCLGGGR